MKDRSWAKPVSPTDNLDVNEAGMGGLGVDSGVRRLGGGSLGRFGDSFRPVLCSTTRILGSDLTARVAESTAAAALTTVTPQGDVDKRLVCALPGGGYVEATVGRWRRACARRGAMKRRLDALS